MYGNGLKVYICLSDKFITQHDITLGEQASVELALSTPQICTHKQRYISYSYICTWEANGFGLQLLGCGLRVFAPWSKFIMDHNHHIGHRMYLK